MRANALRLKLVSLIAILLLNAFAAQGQTTSSDAAVASNSPTAAQNVSLPKLTPGAEQVARLIGVTELMERLFRLPEPERSGRTMTLEALALRQEITEAIVSASLDADGTIAELDSELDHIALIETSLALRRDRTLRINTLANIIASGAGGILGSSLMLKQSTSNLGGAVSIAGGAVSTVLSLIAIHQENGGTLALQDSPNMLAPFFDREREYHSSYPDELWQYINSPVPTEPERGTRRERLSRDWMETGRIEALETPKGKEKIAFLTSRNSEKRQLTLDLLNDRAAMLTGVRTWAELMKRDLSKLMLALRKG